MQSQVKIFCCLALLLLATASEMTQAADENWQMITTAQTVKKSVKNLSPKDRTDTSLSDKIVIQPHSSAQGEVISSYFPVLTCGDGTLKKRHKQRVQFHKLKSC
jgi:hypothetical protein